MIFRRLAYSIFIFSVLGSIVLFVGSFAKAQDPNPVGVQTVKEALPEGMTLESAPFDQIYTAMYSSALAHTCDSTGIASDLIGYLQEERGHLPPGVVENITAAAMRAVFERLQFLTECSSTIVMAELRAVSRNMQSPILTSS